MVHVCWLLSISLHDTLILSTFKLHGMTLGYFWATSYSSKLVPILTTTALINDMHQHELICMSNSTWFNVFTFNLAQLFVVCVQIELSMGYEIVKFFIFGVVFFLYVWYCWLCWYGEFLCLFNCWEMHYLVCECVHRLVVSGVGSEIVGAWGVFQIQ